MRTWPEMIERHEQGVRDIKIYSGMAQAFPEQYYTSALNMEFALMAMAEQWAQARSKSPRSKVGAVLYCTRTGMMSFGYNGLPAGMPDLKATWDNLDPQDPQNLYNLVQHAEMNCIRKAWQCSELFDFPHSILCTTLYPCHHCMKDFIVPSGCKTVWFRDYHHSHDHEAKQASQVLADAAGIRLRQLGA